jgi:hypothetical protein
MGPEAALQGKPVVGTPPATDRTGEVPGNVP